MRKILWLAISLCAIIFSGCSKEESTVAPDLNSQESIIAAPQDTVAATLSGPEQTVPDAPGPTALISNEQINLASQEEMVVPVASLPESNIPSGQKQSASLVQESASEQNVTTQDAQDDTLAAENQES